MQICDCLQEGVPRVSEAIQFSDHKSQGIVIHKLNKQEHGTLSVRRISCLGLIWLCDTPRGILKLFRLFLCLPSIAILWINKLHFYHWRRQCFLYALQFEIDSAPIYSSNIGCHEELKSWWLAFSLGGTILKGHTHLYPIFFYSYKGK